MSGLPEIARAGLAYLYCIISGCPNLCDYQRWSRVKRRGEGGKLNLFRLFLVNKRYCKPIWCLNKFEYFVD